MTEGTFRTAGSGRRGPLGTAAALAAVAWLAAVARPADAQVPGDTVPPADTIPRGDTIPVPDSVAAADTLPVAVPDTLAVDSLAADTLEVEDLPDVPDLVPPGWETAVREWDREALLANRAVSLAGLLEQVPGVVALRGGDFGMPRAATAFGAGGGGLRVFRDGIELLPLEGSVPDLSRIGIGGLEEVRVERSPEGLRLELRTIRSRDPRPYSLIEAGTGDLDTNLLRAVFLHPRVLGGNVALSLDRIDTRGTRGREPGETTSLWLRYAYLRGDRFGLVAELTRAGSGRDTLFTPSRVSRTDWTLRARGELTDGVVADVFWNRAVLKSDPSDGAPEPFPFRATPRSQWGGRLTAERGPFFARTAFRSYQGDGLPDGRMDATAGTRLDDVGGLSASWSRESWEEDASTLRARGWTAPFLGVSLFGSVEDFERTVPFLPAPALDDGNGEPVEPGGPTVDSGSGIRLGARFRWRGLELSGARLDLEADSVRPLGLPMDRGAPSFPAGERSGWEMTARVPLPVVDGLALEASGQAWEETEEPWPYFPRRTWHGGLSLHDTYLPTGNLEVWFDVGVEGRDRMTVALPADGAAPPPGTPPVPADVPFYQSWYTRLQVRVVTVRAFVTWENFTIRQVNQDFPGRILPFTRAMYGIKWTLWN